MSPVLEVKGLQTHFHAEGGVVRAVDGVSFKLQRGETMGIVGESGCGKTATALSIMRLIPSTAGKITGGRILLNGEDLLSLNPQTMRKRRGKDIAMVFQEPMSSLNPVLTIGRQLTEILELHLNLGSDQARRRAITLLEEIGLPDAERRMGEYPHHLSGGMRQRVMIAMALSCQPQVLLADEPTTAVDVTIQAQLLKLIHDLTRERGTAVVLITHDLGIVARYADKVSVMYAGRIVESASANRMYSLPRHPYTLGLLRSVPRLDSAVSHRLMPIQGMPPDLTKRPSGCAFRPRCECSIARCTTEDPGLLEFHGGHLAACWVDVQARFPDGDWR